MPYEWRDENGIRILQVRPYRSLPRTGFVWFIAITALLASLPLLAVLGSVVLWALLPFMLAAIAAIWWAIERNYQSGTSAEYLTLSTDRITLTRHDPGRPDRHWQANPYWVHAVIRPGPVEAYLVLTGDHGSGREVEIGAFLSPAERESLAGELNREIARIRG